MSDFAGAVQLASPGLPGLPRAALLLTLVATTFGRLDRPQPGLTTGRSTVRSRRPAPSDRQRGVHWDGAVWDALAFRLNLLTCAFLASVVPREGREPVADTRAPETLAFVTALQHAAHLLVSSSLQDSPDEFADAVADAERRWRQIVSCQEPPAELGPDP